MRAPGEFWHIRGYLGEGQRWLRTALEGGEAPEGARAKALARAGWIAWEQGRYGRSAVLSKESLALSRKFGDRASVSAALLTLGLAEIRLGGLDEASASLEEATTLQRAASEDADLSRSLSGLVLISVIRQDFDRAAALHEESLALASGRRTPS